MTSPSNPGASSTSSCERVLYADVIRGYALFLVVFSHIFAPICWGMNRFTLPIWWVANILDSWIRPCVPLFVMISGMLLLRTTSDESPGVFLKKRFLKVCIPFIAWTVIYALWQAHANEEPLAWKGLIVNAMQEPIAYHLWFLYMLLGLYLVTPVLRVYVRQADRQNMIYFVCLWFVSVVIPPWLDKFWNVEFSRWFIVLDGYVGYFVLGHLLGPVALNHRERKLAFLAILAILALNAYGTYFLCLHNQRNMDEFFYEYLSPNVIVLSVLTFLWMKSLPYEEYFAEFPLLAGTVRLMSSTSFSIYLMHALAITWLEDGVFGFKLACDTFHPFVGVPLTTLAVFSLCMAATFILRKIPLVRMIVPS